MADDEIVDDATRQGNGRDSLLGVGLSKNPDIEALDPISELARRSARCGPLSSSAEIRLTFLAAKTEEVFEKLNSTARFEWWALFQSVRRMLTLYTLQNVTSPQKYGDIHHIRRFCL